MPDYYLHLPNTTESFVFDDSLELVERIARSNTENNDLDVATVFRVDEDGTKKPIAFYWNGQRFEPR